MSFISEVGRERLGKVQQWLEAGAPHVEVFDNGEQLLPITTFDMYETVGRSGDCGTACCIAGAVVQFSDPLDVRSTFSPQYYTGFGAKAAALLDISQDDADSMFVPSEVEWDSITPAVAAKMLKTYLATGVVDWVAAGAVEESDDDE